MMMTMKLMKTSSLIIVIMTITNVIAGDVNGRSRDDGNSSDGGRNDDNYIDDGGTAIRRKTAIDSSLPTE